ncbi:MAG: 3-deoxy-D-manno-octulosonate 8-phosphate phosphatase [Ignavibacteriae bacterium]|nr:MAG: 3-deoxy-D-manno-octulosonate 8-phosphate phosphatase [Ignavibacteriota bacterium]
MIVEHKKKLKNIKLVITDVDGVLTDGGLYYTEEGLVMKKFNVKDGMGMRLLKMQGIKNAIITTDTSELIKTRGERVKVDYLYLGIWDKDVKMKEICELENISPEEVAFIGDDLNDLEIIEAVGLSACPNNAVDAIKEKVDLILNLNGGEGAFREFADLILANKN